MNFFFFFSLRYAWTEDKLEHIHYNMSWLLQEWTYVAELRWRTASYQLARLQHSVSIWWAR